MSVSRRRSGRTWVKSPFKSPSDRKATSGIQLLAQKLKPAIEGGYYSAKLEANGGTGDLEWAVTEGAIPPGLSLDEATGTISGKPRTEGIGRFTLQVTDGKGAKSNKQDFSLTITPKLAITSEVDRAPDLGNTHEDFVAALHAEGGLQPYNWEMVPRDFKLPGDIKLDANGAIYGGTDGDVYRTTRFTVRCTDNAGHSDTAHFLIKVGRSRSLWFLHRSGNSREIYRASITVKAALRSIFFHRSNYVSGLAFALPTFGAIWIAAYAFTTPGRSGWNYLGVGLLTAFAAFLVGGLGGFLFGIPKLVSSGELRLKTGTRLSPSTNLAEVSDWLTKLLLGAGLVQLTHLGAPIGGLIDDVAAGLSASSKPSEAAKVMAGTILFGYVAIGLLDGYVMTTTLYQNWLARHTGQL
jgi:Putative Ig domain